MNPTGFASPNEKDVSVFKKDHVKRDTNMVTLVFVGIDMVKAIGRNPSPIFVKGGPMNFPELGESITVDSVIAKDIIEKTRWSDSRERGAQPKDVFVRADQGGAEMGRMIKEALANGTPLEELNIYGVQKQHFTSQLSDDELLEALKARGLKVEEESETSKATTKKANPAAVKK